MSPHPLSKGPALLLCAALAACTADPDAPEVWRFAIEETQGSVQHRYALGFEERIEAQTDGAVDVKIYPYGTLGTSDHITELLHNGSIELAMSSPGHLGKLIPEVQVFLLHFVLSDDARVNDLALRDPAVHALLAPLYADKGLSLLSIYSEGWMVWTTNQPVRHPDDFDGVKMRVMTSPLLLAAYSAYGASPTPLPYSEVYSALQLSMIDAQVNPVFAIQEMSFHEVTDHLIFAGHAPFITTAIANQPFYDGLSAERRALVDDTIDALQDTIFTVQTDFERTRLAKIRATRPEIEVTRLTDAERAAFREASLPVRDTYLELAPDQGDAVLEALLNAVESAERQIAQEQGERGEGQQDAGGAEQHGDEGRRAPDDLEVGPPEDGDGGEDVAPEGRGGAPDGDL
jgi:tripartite ATP-independent transporter DctP family solute receptor